MKVKGIAVKSIQSFVSSKFKPRYEEWINSLPESSKKIMVSPVHESEWYSVNDAIVEPTIAVGNLFFNGDIFKAGWEGGKFSADDALQGFYKIFVKISPISIIERASKILPTYYDSCDIKVKELETHHATFIITGSTFSIAVIESRIKGWIFQVFESTGYKNIRLNMLQSLVDGASETIIKVEWD